MATTDKPKSEDKPTAEAVASEKVESPSDDEQAFTLDRLTSGDAEALVGHPGYVVAGAFHGVAGTTEATIKDAKQRIRNWLKAPVTPSEED